jgi:hypothetical protein
MISPADYNRRRQLLVQEIKDLSERLGTAGSFASASLARQIRDKTVELVNFEVLCAPVAGSVGRNENPPREPPFYDPQL